MDKIDLLDEIRRKEGMNNIEFAARLGITKGCWSSLQNRKKGLGRDVLSKIDDAYPELMDDRNIRKIFLQ